MEEELNENELEERLYAMLHHVDETQNNLITTNQHEDNIRLLENAPRSTLRRYWRTSTERNTPNQKVNTQKEPIPTENNKISTAATANNAKPKAEKCVTPKASPTIDLSFLQSAVPQNIKKSIEILDHEMDNHVVLESSDDDEVIEVALPPKPTITIESSDEDELHVIKIDTPTKSSNKQSTFNKPHGIDREVSASPVPSVVSSVSDDFIRGDCIALNISSRHPDNHSFDFSLHGSDLIDHSTPSKKKKKKKSKETVASTAEPVTSTPEKSVVNKNITDECFATPKSKAKNKKQKNKSFVVTEKSFPNADVYDSDSNQSMIDTNKGNSYVVTEKSLPSADVYESDSSHSEPLKDNTNDIESSDSSISIDKPQETPKSSKKVESYGQVNRTHGTISIVDLTENDKYITLDNTGICESIVMANVTGFMESEDYGDENLSQNSPSKFGSTKVPAILNEDLDFDNLKGKNTVCKRRRYSLTTLRAEMEKFYNESWGGEDFNHREIQKNMSRDKSLWMIDPKDRMSSLSRRKVTTCNYCNRTGHRDDTCRLKPPVCYMCGCSGHYEPRCPQKICVNCGSPNQMYSSMCRNCCGWGSASCEECGQRGHPATHCPDLWRRYHNTIDLNTQLEKCNQTKKHHQLFCSGCTRRGHLVHTCRITLPFSGLPINSPYVYFYRPFYSPTNNRAMCNNANKFNKSQQYRNTQESTPSPAEIQFRNDRNKRQSKSPTAHENHVNKKRNVSVTEDNDARRNTKSPINNNTQRKMSVSKEDDTNKTKYQVKTAAVDKVTGVEKAPNFIPLCSTNHDNKGHMIQDNEVSDTSDIVTSARIYVTNEIIDLLKSKEGAEWLKATTNKHSVIVENTEINSFLSIKGKVESQECFQNELRDWMNIKANKENIKSNNEIDTSNENNHDLTLTNIPKNRNNLLRHLNKAFESLKRDLGDPKALYKELTFLQNRHQALLSQKVINPKQLSNSKGHINDMLKKLNMVLIGQAGLADGTGHLSELYSFQEKVMNSRSKVIPIELRKEIGQHYQIIFTALPRDDYRELLKTYHCSKQTSAMSKKKKRDKPYTLGQKMNKLMKMNSIPAQTMHKNEGVNMHGGENMGTAKGKACHIFSKVVIYHKRLLNVRVSNKPLKKKRMELIAKLRNVMNHYTNEDITRSKAIKKLRKAQEEARVFLANV